MRNEMLRDLLALSHVPRWCTHPVNRAQSVADHSFRVVVISKALMDYMAVDSDEHAATIMWALIHDGPESKTGDVPSPFKVHIKADLAKIERTVCPWYLVPDDDSVVSVVVSLADTIEAYSWLKQYGHGFRDRFDDESIENKLSRRIWTMADNWNAKFPGLEHGVRAVMQEIG